MIGHYGEERDLICTEEERRIYENVLEVLKRNDVDLAPADLVRQSENYVTVKYGDWDLVRCKFTTRAKWLLFPVLERPSDKHRIGDPEELFEYSDIIIQSVEHIEKYS